MKQGVSGNPGRKQTVSSRTSGFHAQDATLHPPKRKVAGAPDPTLGSQKGPDRVGRARTQLGAEGGLASPIEVARHPRSPGEPEGSVTRGSVTIGRARGGSPEPPGSGPIRCNCRSNGAGLPVEDGYRVSSDVPGRAPQGAGQNWTLFEVRGVYRRSTEVDKCPLLSRANRDKGKPGRWSQPATSQQAIRFKRRFRRRWTIATCPGRRSPRANEPHRSK